MKKRTATSTILISLAAVGCGPSDSEYVDYQNTAPVETESTEAQEKEAPGPASTDQPPTIKNSEDTQTSDAQKLPADTGVKTASHVVESPQDSIPVNATAADNPNPDASAKLIVSEQSGLTGSADVPQIDSGAPEKANTIELLIPYKSFRRERGTDAVRISYDDIDLLKVLNMEPVPANAPEYFPDWLADLHGKRVRIRGWMYPTFASEGLTQFTMARDNGICCFQRMPKIYDVIFVKLAPGQETDYISQRPFDIEGTFRIDSEGDGSELPRLYKIDNARVLD